MKQKMKVTESITTVNGTLYKDELVILEDVNSNKDYRVKDTMGRIWFVNKKYLKIQSLQQEK
jgi:hypothetical protein|tara:strand:- start:417 stop:602 length:186 start_codon:yes stop_codon:yes gene_type:complete